jgi:DNA-binding LytR/AlgR family response regulator
MNIQTCVIIDDEVHALGNLGDILSRIPGMEIVGKFDNALSAIAGVKTLGSVDYIFSDVEMPGLSGIEAAKHLRMHCQYLIFTTAHSHYAFDAFGEEADGFLLKPLRLATVLEKVEKLRAKAPAPTPPTSNDQSDSLFIKAGSKNGFVRISYFNIVCIDAGDHYPTIYTTDNAIPVYMTMRELEEHLRHRGDFMRVHKSFIVSLNKIKQIDGNTIYLDMLGDNTREVSKTYAKEFFEEINRRALISQKTKQ